ncbi:MAG: hypothetical protein IJG60_07230 [Thermoguttaceae bacterium]|nr:hypothetical protein [Thermoguttaceae bacterium]
MKMFEKTRTASERRQLRKKSFRLESLEERTLLAVYAGLLPAPTGDAPSTVVTTLADTVDDSDGVISLREAIENAKTLKTDITFDVAGTINLTRGQLEITESAVIKGNDEITVRGGGDSRVFYISGSADLSGLTITGGAVAEGNGGGIQVFGGSLTMTDCVVTGNTARTSGGLDVYNGSATVVNSAFTNNSTTWDGGAVQNYLSNMTVINTLFANNSARDGGAIVNWDATMTMTNCTVVNNTASRDGGGIYIGGGGSVTLNNMIVVMNADSQGLDIKVDSTAAFNNSVYQASRAVGSITANNCLDYSEEMVLFTDAAGGDYSLPDSSIAVNTGNNRYVTAETDLAGNPRIVGGIVDMGAYENQTYVPVEPTEDPSSIVTTIDDIVDPHDGQISIREAIAYAGAEETVSFSDTLYTYNADAGEWIETDSRTILLRDGEITITGITGIRSADSDMITIDAGGNSRVFAVSGRLNLSGLTITGGSVAEGNGGGIQVSGGSLTMTDCVVTGNTARTSGALDVYNGSVTVINSIFTNNTATSDGGVSQNYLGNLTFINSLFTNNTGRDGGALVNYEATTILTNCTVTANTAARSGGAVWNFGNLTINNSIVLGNSATENGMDICHAEYGQTVLNASLWVPAHCSGLITSIGCQEYTEGAALFTDAANGDYTLADDSVAINAGNNDYVTASTDLTGNDRIIAILVDQGAYEYVFSTTEEDPSPVVTTIDDVFDPYDGQISLREAVIYAGSDSAVTFAETLYTYNTETGTWVEASGRTILLQGSDILLSGKTTIIATDSNPITVDAGGNSRVFSVTGTAVLEGLTITGGAVAEGNGGGIQVNGGSLTMTDCIVTGNTARTSGALDVYNGSATVVNSAFTNNSTSWDGGAVQNFLGNLTVINSLFANNSGRDGGAFLNWQATTTLTNCTFANNTATGSGGGIYNGGGGTLVLNNTIVVKNDASAGQDIQADSVVTLNNSVYQTARCTGEIAANDCVTYTSKKVLFANADAGDYTLATGSIAIDAGNMDAVSYGFDLAGNERIQGVTVDIGAYEANGAKWNINRSVDEGAKTIVYTVDSLEDTIANDSKTTLREAILYANGDNSRDYDISIRFTQSLSGGTIHLAGNELAVLNVFAVDAGDLADGLTVSADGLSRVFGITAGTADNPVRLAGLTITGGAVAEGNGGGIQVSGGSLTMTDCVVTGNTARTSGALDLQNGSATIVNSVLTNNSASGDGGAVQNYNGTLNAVNTLFANNSARDGGAIVNWVATMTMTNCTVTGNRADRSGGAVWNYGDLFINNSVVLGNSGTENGPDICHAGYGQTGLNSSLWVSANCSGEITANGCLEYVEGTPLFTDAANGDYTLVSGSVAINAGNNDYVTVSTDLAGNDRIVGGIVDMGAYEYQGGGETEPLAAPTISTGKGVYVSYGANRHFLQWSAVENASGYELAYSTDGSTWTTVSAAETSAVITGLTYGAKMTYRVRALGEGSYTDSDWSTSKTFSVCPMDINNDEDISGGDRTLLAQAWLSEEGEENYQYYADINGDGDIGGADRAYLANNWLLNVEDDADDLQYPPARSADAVFAEFASADLDVVLDLF